MRTRTLLQNSKFGGSKCPALVETKKCNEQACDRPGDYVMFGTGINGMKKVDKMYLLDDNVKIFLIQDGKYVKMITSKGEGYYYDGKLSFFDKKNIKSYLRALPGTYEVKKIKEAKKQNEESKEDPKNYLLYGSGIKGQKYADKIFILPNGKKIFIIQDGEFVKMVTENQNGYYYIGKISDFDSYNIKSYLKTANGTFYVKNIGEATKTLPVKSPKKIKLSDDNIKKLQLGSQYKVPGKNKKSETEIKNMQIQSGKKSPKVSKSKATYNIQNIEEEKIKKYQLESGLKPLRKKIPKGYNSLEVI